MTLHKYILDDNGDPVPEPNLIKWAIWFEKSDERRRVALTYIGKVHVSTVFLGVDHCYENLRAGRRKAPPILYETKVFGGTLDDLTDRYSTRVQALAGHDQFVAQVRESIAKRKKGKR